MTISSLSLQDDEKTVAWVSSGVDQRRRYGDSVRAQILGDKSGIVVLEPYVGDPNNSIIVNPDGTVRRRIKNPHGASGGIWFLDLYRENGDVILLIAHRGSQYACVLDKAGNIAHIRESR